jgi:hypothetical protein
LLAGASGETIQPNFFLEDFKLLQTQLLKRGWHVAVVAGTHDGELPGSFAATNAHLAQGVRATLESVKPGGEALIVFHSHGREREKQWGQRSHSIVSEERDASGVDTGFDLDTIEPDLLKAQARGVRVALIDLSCYSGSTQALKGTACTVTLAAGDYVSLCSGRPEERSFNSKFFQLPTGPVDLEAQFLAARRDDDESINLPQISSRKTPAIDGWEDFLKQADPLDTYEELKNLQAGAPAYDPRRLLGPLDRWIATQPPSPKLKKLRAVVSERLALVLTLRKRIEGEIKPLTRDYDDAALALELAGRAPMKLATASLAEVLDAVETGKIPDGYSEAQRNMLKALEPRRGELASRYALKLADFRSRRDHFDQLTQAMEEAAGSLFAAEREIYDLAQPAARALSSASGTRAGGGASDPCQDFAL